MKRLECLNPVELRQFFACAGKEPLDVAVEEHIVHCETCLAVVKEASADDLCSGLLPRQSGNTCDVLDRLIDTLLEMRPDTAVEIRHETLLSPAQQPDELGRLARYRVLRLLGMGGMGVVYEAEDLDLGRRVALKVMKPYLLAGDAGRQRFLNEARAAAAIEHDHIVAIYQVGEVNGVPFLAMPLLRGCNLDAYLKRTEALSVAEVLGIGRQIAQGLAAAHARGFIHRDIKPTNIWLETQDSIAPARVKILDFGLARAESADTNFTQTGVIIGSLGFMAPEQIDQAELDQRCDLYSLGCVLYTMATGRKPFEGKGSMAVLRAMALNQPVEPRALRRTLPQPLSDLILKLMDKDPVQRPQSAQAVVEQLAALERSDLDPLPAVRQKAATDMKPGRLRFAAVAAGLLALVAGAAVYFLQTPNGTIGVEVKDPGIEVKLGVDKLLVSGAGEREIAITPGDNWLHVERDGFGFDTKQFAVGKGDKVRFSVEWLDARLVVRKDGVAFDEASKPKEPLAVLPLETPDQRAAAEWVLSKNGFVTIRIDGKDVVVNKTKTGTTVDQLPKGPYTIVGVSLSTSNAATLPINDHDLRQLGCLSQLESLNFGHQPVTAAGLAHFAGCARLKYLGIGDTAVRLDGLPILAKFSRLEGFQFNFAEADQWADALAKIPTLREVYAYRCDLTTVGVAHLARLPKLEKLLLEDCGGITDDALKALTSCRSLRTLVLDDLKTTVEGVQRLKQALPKCEIKYLGKLVPAPP